MDFVLVFFNCVHNIIYLFLLAIAIWKHKQLVSHLAKKKWINFTKAGPHQFEKGGVPFFVHCFMCMVKVRIWFYEPWT